MLEALTLVVSLECAPRDEALRIHKQWGANTPIATTLTSEDILLELWERKDGVIFFTMTENGVTCIISSIERGEAI